MNLQEKYHTIRDQWSWREAWRNLWRGVWVLLLAFGLLLGVGGLRPDLSDSQYPSLIIAKDVLFDFVAWELEALRDKAATGSLQLQAYMDEETRSAYVLDYLELVRHIQLNEREVQAIYTDPAILTPLAASADLRAEQDRLRAEQKERQGLAEAIIQAQTAEILKDYGFGLGNGILPPVMIRFTPLPSILIVSRRDRIERIGSYPLEYGLTVNVMEDIEREVDARQDESALIVPIGGLSVWPAMLLESGNTSWVMDVTAHEWAHHYLTFFPLGANYGQSPELFTINETVASIVGAEIGWALMDRYYPDLAPPPPDFTPQPPSPENIPPPETDDPPAFDFRTEMRITRTQADSLLAAGQIEQAETYMEARRVMFVEQGYRIRKINQAYFAFYGAYADEPGAAGADPIGPALRDLRYYSGSLEAFIGHIRGMTTFVEVQEKLGELRAAYE